MSNLKPLVFTFTLLTLLIPALLEAQNPRMVKDINVQPSSPYLRKAMSSSGRDYFVASESMHGYELWTRDANHPEGILVKDINAGESDGLREDDDHTTELFAFGGKTFFNANDGQHGLELWMTDGTEAGTSMVFDFKPGAQSGNPIVVGTYSDKLLVLADGSLWTFNLVTTTKLTTKSVGWNVAVYGDKVYFEVGKQLWKTNGQIEEMVIDFEQVFPGQNAYIGEMAPTANGLSFLLSRANGGNWERELWISDGTASGTQQILSEAGFSLIELPGGRVLFLGGASSDSVFSTDGTTAGTYELHTFTSCSRFEEGVILGSDYYFSCIGEDYYSELWRTNGLPSGTLMIDGHIIGSELVLMNGYIYYISFERNYQGSLNRVSGNSSVTVHVFPEEGNIGVDALFALSSNLLLELDDHDLDTSSLWLNDGFSDELTPFSLTLQGATGSSYPGILGVLGSDILFRADDGINGYQLWKSNGTEAGTTQVANVRVCSSGDSSLVLNDTLYFIGDDGVHGCELWKSDGTAGGTIMVKDVVPGSDAPDSYEIVSLNGLIYFATGETFYERLYKTDGTPGGTVEVKNSSGNSLSAVSNLAVIGARIFFQAEDTNYDFGVEPWISDGTSTGTTMLSDIYPGDYNSYPDAFKFYNGWIYFAANGEGVGRELFRTNGTPEGTSLFKNFARDEEDWSRDGLGWDSDLFHVIGGTMYFSANDGTRGHEAWRTDGTLDGTFMLVDNPVDCPLDGYCTVSFGDLNGIAYFSLYHYRRDTPSKIWKSNGTTEGTVELPVYGNPSTSIFGPSEMLSLNGYLYMDPFSSIAGVELYRTNGSASETYLLADISPGTGSSSPSDFTPVGNSLFFVAKSPDKGTELMVFDTEEVISDLCPEDPDKVEPGICGCGISDSDSDGDSVANCFDSCGSDPLKTAPGICGCGTSDIDSDGDLTADCFDGCTSDALKTQAGVCGCGISDADSNGNGVADCHDPHIALVVPAKPKLKQVKMTVRVDLTPMTGVRYAVSYTLTPAKKTKKKPKVIRKLLQAPSMQIKKVKSGDTLKINYHYVLDGAVVTISRESPTGKLKIKKK